MFQATDKFESERRDEVVAAGKEAAAKQLAKLMESDEMKNTIRGVCCSLFVGVRGPTHACTCAHACVQACDALRHHRRRRATRPLVAISAARDSSVACAQPYA